MDTPIESWSNEQIYRFSKWFDRRHPHFFLNIFQLERQLEKLGIPFFYSQKNLSKKRNYYLCIGDENRYFATKIRRVIFSGSKQLGIWTSTLIAIILVWLGVMEKPKDQKFIGAEPLFYACQKIWRNFLIYKISQATQLSKSE